MPLAIAIIGLKAFSFLLIFLVLERYGPGAGTVWPWCWNGMALVLERYRKVGVYG